MKNKERLDVLLVQKGFFESRERAKSSIMAGLVFVDNQKVDKAGTNVLIDSEITVKNDSCPYVSRGGLKLEKALKAFSESPLELICLDIGASTGGFTDCMLKNGAQKVYAVDVGYGQLDWKLRNDDRVINREKINIRYVVKEDFSDIIEFITIDVSFISLELVLPVAQSIVKDNGTIICLVKPQFEAGREQVGKNGIVRDKRVHLDVLNKVVSFAKSIGLCAKGLTFSPMTGAKGNIEYLLYLKKVEEDSTEIDIAEVIDEAHEKLGK